MRHILQQSLGRSLEAMPELDRLQAAWPVACGKALAAQGDITAFTAGVVRVHVENDAWLDQMRSMGAVLERELAKIARVRVSGYTLKEAPNQPRRAEPRRNRLFRGGPGRNKHHEWRHHGRCTARSRTGES